MKKIFKFIWKHLQTIIIMAVCVFTMNIIGGLVTLLLLLTELQVEITDKYRKDESERADMYYRQYLKLKYPTLDLN